MLEVEIPSLLVIVYSPQWESDQRAQRSGFKSQIDSGWRHGFGTKWIFGQIVKPLGASASPSVKWGWECLFYLPEEVVVRVWRANRYKNILWRAEYGPGMRGSCLSPLRYPLLILIPKKGLWKQLRILGHNLSIFKSQERPEGLHVVGGIAKEVMCLL